MTVAISRAAATGARVAICASTGNTVGIAGGLCGRAGIHAVVLVPSTGISEAKVAQTLDYGATVVAIDGDFDAALATVRALDPRACRDRELRQSVSHRRPEVGRVRDARSSAAGACRIGSSLPGGNLGNTSAFGKGFREALALG